MNKTTEKQEKPVNVPVAQNVPTSHKKLQNYFFFQMSVIFFGVV